MARALIRVAQAGTHVRTEGLGRAWATWSIFERPANGRHANRRRTRRPRTGVGQAVRKPSASSRRRSRESRARPRRAPARYGGWSMKSPVVKRSIVIAGHKTSVSLEDAFWQGLKQIAAERDITLVRHGRDDRHGSPSGQPVVGHPPVRAGLLPRARQSAGARQRGPHVSRNAATAWQRPAQSAASALRSE